MASGPEPAWKSVGELASIGVALRRWVSWHGFALNVAADIEGFARITPCGIAGVQMTSVAAEGGPGEVDAAIPVVLERFLEVFGYQGWTPLTTSDGGEAQP